MCSEMAGIWKESVVKVPVQLQQSVLNWAFKALGVILGPDFDLKFSADLFLHYQNKG
jgi:hypothetical protein